MGRLQEIQKMIAGLRKQGFTRYRIAKVCDVSWKTVVDWENGKHLNPRINNYRALEKFFSDPDKGYLND